MDQGADHYATLGVTPQADAMAIRAAYRSLMRRYHPDVNASDDASAKATAINEAYDCLSDEAKRAAYDRQRAPRHQAEDHAEAPRHHRARQTHWQDYPAFSPVPEPEPQPASVRFAIFGLAALVTLITFTLTSATPSIAVAEPVTTVQVAP